MSATFLRLGLWTLVLVLALYVVHETVENSPVKEFIPTSVLQKAMALGGILIAAGIITRMFEKTAKVVTRNRCVICRTQVAPGAIYCREHLRNVLQNEDDKIHRTRSGR